MDFLKFISQNWAQIAIIIGAVGYFVKVILDFQIKKREIKFSFIYQEKTDAFHNFFLSFQDFKRLLLDNCFRYKNGMITFDEFEKILRLGRDEIQTNIDHIYIYCSKKEIELLYRISNTTSTIHYRVRDTDEAGLSELILNYDEQNRKVVSKLIRRL